MSKSLYINATCVIPNLYVKTLFAIEDGKETTTRILSTELIQDQENFRGTCHEIVSMNLKSENSVNDTVVVYKNQ